MKTKSFFLRALILGAIVLMASCKKEQVDMPKSENLASSSLTKKKANISSSTSFNDPNDPNDPFNIQMSDFSNFGYAIEDVGAVANTTKVFEWEICHQIAFLYKIVSNESITFTSKMAPTGSRYKFVAIKHNFSTLVGVSTLTWTESGATTNVWPSACSVKIQGNLSAASLNKSVSGTQIFNAPLPNE